MCVHRAGEEPWSESRGPIAVGWQAPLWDREQKILITYDPLVGSQISAVAYYCSSMWGTVVTVSYLPALGRDS